METVKKVETAPNVRDELEKARLRVLTEMQSAYGAGDIKVLAEAWALLCNQPPRQD